MDSNSTDKDPSDLTDPDASGLHLLSPSELRVVLVCDVVESVRWMEHDEDYAISRWQAFSHQVREVIAPAHNGCVVKSTGDGLMLEFASAPQAVKAATAMHGFAVAANDGVIPERQMHLRIGLNEAHIRRDAHDIYGHGVNLAARITALAGPGEIVVTPEVRDFLTDLLDGDIEDLGECYLKHLDSPQRVYRIGLLNQTTPRVPVPAHHAESLQPKIAVIPFDVSALSAEHRSIGDLIADGVIARLVRSKSVRVLSRLSTASLRGLSTSPTRVHNLVGADYVMRGSVASISGRFSISYELSHATSSEVLDAGRLAGTVDDLLRPDSESCAHIADALLRQLFEENVQSALTRPLPHLPSYSLFLGGIAGIHRSLPLENLAGEAALQHVINRHPRSAEPAAWLAQWLAIRVSRGLAAHPEQEIKKAKFLVNRALDAEPNSAFALTVSGLVEAYFIRDFTRADQLYGDALTLNPSDSLAWLYRSTLMAWMDRGSEGVEYAEKALQLSPLHPMRYYIESLAAVPYLVSGDYAKAIALCQQSLKGNRSHASTHRVLVMATELAGNNLDLVTRVQALLQIDPTLTVESFVRRYPGNSGKFVNDMGAALARAGVPLK